MSYFDIQDQINTNYGVIGVPAAYYIDSEGVIKDIAFGEDTPEGILEKINE